MMHAPAGCSGFTGAEWVWRRDASLCAASAAAATKDLGTGGILCNLGYCRPEKFKLRSVTCLRSNDDLLHIVSTQRRDE